MSEEKTAARTIGRDDYEERQENRRDRLEDRADKARGESDRRYTASRAETQHIPLGQPILIGHHSEKRHRNALKKSDNNMRASIQYNEKANELDARAAGVGRGGISADNPEAIQLLEAKIAEIEERRDFGKKLNKSLNKHKKKLGGEELVQALIGDGCPEKTARLLATPHSVSGKLYGVSVSSDTTEIRRLNQRLKGLRALLAAPPFETIRGKVRGEDGEPVEWEAFEDTEQNRVCLSFDGKISKELWKWCHGEMSRRWSRAQARFQISPANGGLARVKRLCEELRARPEAIEDLANDPEFGKRGI